MGKNNAFLRLPEFLLAGFFAIFFLYPAAQVVLLALPDAGEAFAFLSSPQTILLVWNSVSQALVSTLFALAIGIPLAYVCARRTFPMKKLLKSVSLIPFVFPSILVVISFVIIFGNSGWINSLLQGAGLGNGIGFLYGFQGIVLAHSFYNFPIVMRFVSDAWEKTGSEMKACAKTLGANPLAVFLRVTLPQLLPSIIASASLVFIYAFMSFAIVLSLGGLMFSTLEVEIYRLITRNMDFSAGALLSLLQFAILALASAVYFRFSSKGIPLGESAEAPRKIIISSPAGALEALAVILGAAFIILPVAAIFIFAFTNPSSGAFSLAAFEKIFFPQTAGLLPTTPLASILTSLCLAAAASAIACFFALIAALKSRKTGTTILLLGASMAVSAVTLGLGYRLAFGGAQLWVAALAHSLISFPFAYRIIRNAALTIDGNAVDCARSLGASRFEVFRRIEFPLLRRALFVSTAFCFAISLGELAVVLLLYDGAFATMPVYIYRLISAFDLHAASAMGIILVAASFGCFYTIEHLSGGEAVP